ncbi:hypothetical protein [Desulforhopalus singaporensis]|uniref:CopG family transcriptional regulator n=1 Tax=Desulforhopalus singaporensis TaxID=91360 RepID=A0A1H0TJQ1_9BACT|nr:hypothetical protein [Desulforhopalus singaporensis]SDP53910.1 hypothetical protein SAMN05660330_03126 [Desulforhopalus singaporensis]
MKERLCQMPSEYADQPTVTITLEIPAKLLEEVKEAAVLDETDYKQIINCYIQQGLSESRSEVKRMKFEEHAKEILTRHGVDSTAVDEILHKVQF